MRSITRLNRQLLIWMAAVTGFALALTIAGMVLFYAFVEHIDPLFWENDWNSSWPQPLEWAAFITLWVLGMVCATVAAAKFTRRLIGPLEAVGSAAQSIARGDLTAQAVFHGAMFDETRQLVHDFNAMADRLRLSDAEMRAWNSAIAHELRTPLTILRGRLQGIFDGAFAPETAGGLIAQVDSLTRIVGDLRVFTLARGGRLELQLENIDLATEVATVTSVVASELKDAGIDVLFDLGSSAQVVADSARVRQAILAILDNARRYASPGTLRIETHVTPDAGVVRISDEGPGLPPGSERLVFEPFWRADESRSRARGGSGLGLAVVQAIAQAHGGEALARAATPKGATFEIHLPRAQSDRAQEKLSSGPVDVGH